MIWFKGDIEATSSKEIHSIFFRSYFIFLSSFFIMLCNIKCSLLKHLNIFVQFTWLFMFTFIILSLFLIFFLESNMTLLLQTNKKISKNKENWVYSSRQSSNIPFINTTQASIIASLHSIKLRGFVFAHYYML